eukprot:GHVR01161430.1.p1 GENE.GHVR01161430.1~~GHVR01161430.1.p1  ORF type:complete len:238 (+),score=22.93 GHVR01161430.1:24-737(+)
MSNSTQLIAKHDAPVTSPTFGANGDLFVVATTGDILRYSGNIIDGQEISVEPWGSSSGQPMGLALDTRGAAIVCDSAHQCLLRIRKVVEDGQTKQEMLPYFSEYEGQAMLGPNSVVVAPTTGSLFFTDSGHLGESSLASPQGSVYQVHSNSQILLPLLHRCLAHPAGICLSPDEQILYVAETFRNRILRLVQNPPGVFVTSVFCQLSGRMGPTALACAASGELFVAHYDLQGLCCCL